MATNVSKKPSRELRPAAVKLKEAGMERVISAMVRARESGITPKVVGQSHRMKSH